jgi:AGZA family xanthine/uracil permease-like MFS transporter
VHTILVFVLIPLTFSITQGVIWGFLVHMVIKLVLGKAREIHTIVYFIGAFALLVFAVGL